MTRCEPPISDSRASRARGSGEASWRFSPSQVARTEQRGQSRKAQFLALSRSPAWAEPSKPSSGSDFVSRWDLMQTPAKARFKRLMVAVLRGTDWLAVLDRSEALKGRNSRESVRAAKKALDPYTVQDRLPRRWSFGRREHP